MPDLSKLEALIARLAGIDFSQSSEQDTREIAVNTIIGELGWDTLDRNEVAREYSVRGGRVDYCLRSRTRNLILIEVKRAGTNLTEYQEQLLRYAFDEGVPLAALTDGLVWWLYLPTAEGSWEQRRFARVNFREQQAPEAAAALYRFLNRNGATSGEAHKEAKREFESQERYRRVRAALQDAWERVLNDPDSLLREELAEAVEKISGHRPESGQIADFLQGMLRNAGGEGEAFAVRTAQTDAGRQAGTSVDDSVAIDDGKSQAGGQPEMSVKSPAKRRGIKNRSRPSVVFWLDSARYEVTTLRQVLARLCELLAEQAGSRFRERALAMQSRHGPHFSLSREDLRKPLNIGETGLYVDVVGKSSAKYIEQFSKRLLREVRGSDEDFRIEVRTESHDS